MQRYSLIVVTDETKPIRRFDVARRTLVRFSTRKWSCAKAAIWGRWVMQRTW